MAAILEGMCSNVAGRRHELDLVLMPGVRRDAQAPGTDRERLLGVATGNLEMIGWIKIEQAGLREWFRFGGFSDQFPVRSDLIGDAASKAREMAGPQARVCVVGDTPRDIEAAHTNGLPVIAVATGHFNFDELLEAEAGGVHNFPCRLARCNSGRSMKNLLIRKRQRSLMAILLAVSISGLNAQQATPPNQTSAPQVTSAQAAAQQIPGNEKTKPVSGKGSQTRGQALHRSHQAF